MGKEIFKNYNKTVLNLESMMVYKSICLSNKETSFFQTFLNEKALDIYENNL